MTYATLSFIFILILYGFTVVFFDCHLGQRSSDKWNEINLDIGQFQWYLFPNDLKRILPTIIVVAQKPVEMECFGSFSLSHETFKKVSGLVR